MKAILIGIFIMLVKMGIAEEIDGVKYQLPSDCWEVSNLFENEQQMVKTYTLKEESIEKWNELVTIQKVNGLTMSPSEFFDLFIKQLETLAKGVKIQTTIFENTPTELYAEWGIKDSVENQHEWVKMNKTKNGYVILRYTTKNLEKLDQAKKTAEQFLGV